MALRIEVNGGVLDTPNDFQLELELTSPIFNTRGSQSPSFTLPGSPTNLRLLGYPNRIDRNVELRPIDGVISDGPFRRQCKLNILSAGPDGIEMSVGTDESILYAAWSDVKLRDIEGWPVYTPEASTDAEKVTLLINMLDLVYRRQLDTDYHVFPVAVERHESDDDVSYTVANEIKASSLRPESNLIYEQRQITTTSGTDTATVTVPRGYGLTPFLRVGRLLSLLFDLYGITLEENPFERDPQLARLVVLNNTLDTICAGYLDYRDMLPDCTVNDLLDSLFARFGAVVYLHAATMTARIVLLRDSFEASPSADWDSLKACRSKITVAAPQSLKLSSPTSYEGASPAEDSYDVFMDKYERVIDTVTDYPGVWTRPLLVLDQFSGNVYKNIRKFEGNTEKRDTSLFSSMFFPWYREYDGMDTLEISGKDECVPMGKVHFEDMTNPSVPVGMFCPMFLCGVRNAHTVVKGMLAIDTDDTLNAETDLALCFAHGELVTELGDATGRFYGSPFCRRFDGNRYVDADGNVYTYSLIYVGEDGAYNRFWKAYDAFLRHANHTVELDVNFTRSLINTMDMSKPIMLMGQLLMIDKTSRRLPMSGVSAAMTTFRTMKLLEPYDLASEQNPRQIVPQENAWQYFTNQEKACEAAKVELIDTVRTYIYNISPIGEIREFSIQSAEYGIDSPTIDTSVWESFGAPSDEDVRQGKIFRDYFVCNMSYKISAKYYWHANTEGDGWKTFVYSSDNFGLYSVAFQAGVRAVKRG